MSKTAELRKLTSQLVDELDSSPHAALARRVAAAADALAQGFEAVHTFVINGAGPLLAEACGPSPAALPSPIQAEPSA